MTKRTFILLTIIAYIVIAMLAFGKLPKTFFQQDEWAIFGNLMYEDKTKLSLFNKLFIYEQDTHLVPFTNILTLIEYRAFGVHFAPYAWLSIGFQIISAFLVFVLANTLIKKHWVAFLAGSFFLINSISHQAITWVATTNGTAGSTIFLLFSLILFAKYLTGKRTLLLLLGAYALFLISLGFKETSIFAFVFFPLFWWILTPKKTVKEAAQIIFPLGLFGLAYVGVRLYFRLSAPPSPVQAELIQPGIFVYGFRMFALPIRMLVQSLLPVQVTLDLSRNLVLLAYPHFTSGNAPDPYLVEGPASDIIFFFFFSLVVSLRFFARNYLQKKKEYRNAELLDAALIFMGLSALPLIVVPGIAGYLSLLDGRHMYITDIFTSILVAIVSYVLFLRLARSKFGLAVLVIIIAAFSGYHIIRIRKDINTQVAIADQRVPILNKVVSLYPKLPKNVVFYITSDAPFYGLPYGEPIVPFQSGFGQTLLVWYNAHGVNIPSCLFEHKFLYVLLDEEYKECQGQGFGYFRKPNTMNQALATYQFTPEDVIAFHYTSRTQSFDDITPQVRERILRFGHL